MELHRPQLLHGIAKHMGRLLGLCYVEGTQQLSRQVSRELQEQPPKLLAEHELRLAMTLQLPMCLQQSLHCHTMQLQAMDESLVSMAPDQRPPPSRDEVVQ
jgi:hypothetical protein